MVQRCIQSTVRIDTSGDERFVHCERDESRQDQRYLASRLMRVTQGPIYSDASRN
jgi:hypothetical protein